MAMAAGILTAGSAILGGIQANQQGKIQQQIAENERKIQIKNAERAVAVGQLEQQDQDLQAADIIGRQTAEQGASGFAINSGSFQRLRSSQRQIARRDSLNIRNEADLKKVNFLRAGESARVQGQVARTRGRNALFGSFLKGGSSLISSASRTGNNGAGGSTSLLS